MSAPLDRFPEPAKRQRQPLWPWLLMPLVTLAIFLVLRTARQTPVAPTERAAPGETGQPVAPDAGTVELSGRRG